MKKIYIKPEIKEVIISSMRMLTGSPRKVEFKGRQDVGGERVDDEVDDFDQLL